MKKIKFSSQHLTLLEQHSIGSNLLCKTIRSMIIISKTERPEQFSAIFKSLKSTFKEHLETSKLNIMPNDDSNKFTRKDQHSLTHPNFCNLLHTPLGAIISLHPFRKTV